MKKNTNLILNTLIILVATLIIAVTPTEKEGAIYNDTVRLHILANSDSEADQSLKIKIRDRILEKYGKELKMARSKSDAEKAILSLTESIRLDTNEWIREYGEEYTARVELGEEWYETREYKDFTLPCGYYTSLRIMLGEAEGQNWWCVMYPPLCLELATEDAPDDDAIVGYTKEESALIKKGQYNIKFKILELLSESLGDL